MERQREILTTASGHLACLCSFFCVLPRHRDQQMYRELGQTFTLTPYRERESPTANAKRKLVRLRTIYWNKT